MYSMGTLLHAGGVKDTMGGFPYLAESRASGCPVQQGISKFTDGSSRSLAYVTNKIVTGCRVLSERDTTTSVTVSLYHSGDQGQSNGHFVTVTKNVR